ncbi:alanine/glycine:cation symporter family protein [Devriesea agamarum]|uniref:alanine/glycine:cation symporter family protein n=1 Tax=Devriesea agamarum TaxID=472569 RepID=UPI00071D3FA8|nr:sodium:alanine symporter family protein [Devriesea agamarum]
MPEDTSFLTHLNDIIVAIDGIVWGPFLLIPLLLGTGIFLTIRLTGLQLRKLIPALRLAFVDRTDEGADDQGEISQFQALTTALAATVGVGNIVGVAGAISIGGPGSLFWMWMTGLFGMVTKYSEAFLAVRFRTKDASGAYSGGPQYYLRQGLTQHFGWKVFPAILSVLFAIFAILASFGIGNTTQGNAVSTNMEGTFGIPVWVTGLVITVLTGIVLIGGIKAIGKVTAAFVPIMIVFYILGATWILIANVSAIPDAIVLIFTEAFSGSAAAGGLFGSAFLLMMQLGVARGLFSNESGLGSAPIAAASARTYHPVRQGLVSMTQTFIDTLVVVTFTGLVLVTTGVWKEDIDKGVMTNHAFSHGLPGEWGGYIVTIGLVMFAFSTILGWSYYGERCVERLMGLRAVYVYRVVFTLMVFVGATVPLDIVWNFADLMNGLMALPNLIGLLLLSGLIARETKFYLDRDPTLRADRATVEEFMGESSASRR